MGRVQRCPLPSWTALQGTRCFLAKAAFRSMLQNGPWSAQGFNKSLPSKPQIHKVGVAG